MTGHPAELFGPSTEEIKQYVDILASRGVEWGLLGPREGERLWDRHVLNSVALAPLLPEGATVVDVGSGAGLPGLPLALYRPDLKVTLLESLLRRSEFLELAVEELGLSDRVQVVRARAEDHRGSYQVVTARAVAPLDRLVGWCVPLVAPGGAIVALKGASASAELAASAGSLRRDRLTGVVRELPVPGTDEVTWAVEIRRHGDPQTLS
ncbi:16S rRNA m(7)G-527 methyltransferase [Propionicimonas paludicola]|uniref:Ribosomal RNA small subunit methyltransferase G n=1 Tax=Propionicimonas paludicola TaxID=185243 RepID=A0A2A9CX96_9ACTN|nr:16S rRNA (guanine(527)-N(7))-methyltransferase RsmG [Propionicimonas paludicola]PFG18199.1 16S rRNA m(7)G-527 methyltransferase [Propionicimonas paludicola]